MCAFPSQILVLGIGGGLAGLVQRLEHECRLLRQEPDMPRMVRPSIALPPGASRAVAGVLPVSAAESAAWRGAATLCEEGPSQVAESRSLWMTAGQFRRAIRVVRVENLPHDRCHQFFRARRCALGDVSGERGKHVHGNADERTHGGLHLLTMFTVQPSS